MPQIYLEDGLEISYAPHEIQTDDDLTAKNLSRDGYKAIRAARVERERHAPNPGELTPDFTIERLSSDGKRTNEICQLSQSRGKPVALIFGSYT